MKANPVHPSIKPTAQLIRVLGIVGTWLRDNRDRPTVPRSELDTLQIRLDTELLFGGWLSRKEG